MDPKTTLPGHKELSNPSFTVLLEGLDISAKYGIASFMVNKRINRIPVAEVVLYDGSPSKQNWELSNKTEFSPGKEITIKAGYKQNDEVIFTGIILKQSIKATLKSASTLCLELKDKSIKATINRKNKYFADKKDSEIISDILSANGIKGTVDTTTTMHKEMVQYYSTDWDFVLSRAEMNGLLAFVEDGKVNIQKPDFVAKANALILEYGTNIVDVEAELDARDQYGNVTAKDWDYSKQEVKEEKATPPTMPQEEGDITGKKLSEVLGTDDYLLQHPGKMPEGELTAWASAKLLLSRMSKIKGRIRVYGTNAIKPGDVVKLQGLGAHFNGPAFVSGVTHVNSAYAPWYTDIHFGYSSEWYYEKYDNIMDKPSSGLLPAVNGLISGIVTDIVDEDGGEFRVRVRIPLIDAGDKGVWARIVSADAGNGRGILIRPEVDDEVILGFVNDDPRDPVILGMLYSKKNKVPDDFKPTKENKIKGWLTKSKIEFIIDDDKKIVTVKTPGKNSIIISDDAKSITLEDQNKNKIVMDDKGITIDTPKKLTLKATDDIVIEGKKNITAKATSQFKASGNSGMEVSSSGTATLKGSIVKIN